MNNVSCVLPCLLLLTQLIGCLDTADQRAGTKVANNGVADDRGGKLFTSYCAACHQQDGRGLAGNIPPLANSAWVNGSAERLVRVVLDGVRGPIEINGETFNREMPGFGPIFGDDEVASVLTFVRRRYGGSQTPITAATVRRIRNTTRGRTEYWTVDELPAD